MASYWQYLKNSFPPKLLEIAAKAEKIALPELEKVTEISQKNQIRVLKAFQQAGVSELHLKDGTGYGYGDLGRAGLEEVYALTFGGEAALVRAQIVSGTHALSLGLASLLRPGDELLSVTGTPYDSLATVIGIMGNVRGSFREQGISYNEAPLMAEGKPDFPAIDRVLSEKTKVVLIQRSRGYSWRRALCIEEIGEIISFIKQKYPQVICFVDNCYGEFIEEIEPPHVGADITAGSLIKNPGGGIAPTGGYLVGNRELIAGAADRLIAPGLGNEIGTNLGLGRLFYQGLFLAPQIVGEALKGIIFAAHFFSLINFKTSPFPGGIRSDLVQAVELGSKEAVKRFCKGIQGASPVDSFVTPEPGELAGYADDIIMAAGTFIEGASLELTADGPLRPPYIVYLQGGLSYAHTTYAVLNAVKELIKNGYSIKDCHI